MRRPIAVLLLAFATFVHAADRVPSLPAETLAGTPLAVPAAWPATPVVAVVGFSRASGDPCRAWSERLRAAGLDGLAVYQVAVIDEVPGLLRGMVSSSIRKSVPSALHDRFLLVTEQGEAWKKLAGYARPDVPYVLLFDARHSLRWHAAGELDESAYRALRAAVSQLTGAH
jgi:hypothetical protein